LIRIVCTVAFALRALSMVSSSSQHHQPHTTPFSVTDILSPIEESYRKLELSGSGAPPSPYRSSTGGSSAGSSTGGVGGTVVSNAPVPSPGGGAATAVMAANPYMHVGQLSHHQFPTQYCNGSDISTHYGDMRNSAAAAAGWYGATANDPRFAISRLMGSSATAGMNMNMGNMSSLSTCSVTGDTKPMQFPLAQRRKRRVLFTQAQTCKVMAHDFKNQQERK
ncbi:hypothetical protein L9F63_006598, partial [Diploptera punctata]